MQIAAAAAPSSETLALAAVVCNKELTFRGDGG